MDKFTGHRKNPVSAIMYIWNSGDMEYCVYGEREEEA